MRSNKSNATRYLLRRNLFIGVIVFLIAFYMMPVWGLSHLPNARTLVEGYYSSGEAEAELERIVSVAVMTEQQNLETMVILYGGLGFLTAMVLMGHLFSRRKSMLHAALPDRRETDFLRRCIAYAALCLAPIVINFLLYLLVAAANGLLGYVAWGRLLPKFGMLLLINVYGFAMGMLCSVLTGTWWAALLAGGVLIVGVEALASLWYNLAAQYLHTLVNTSFTEMMERLSPAYSLYKGFYRPAQYGCWAGIAATVLALALSFLLYRIRKTEMAERTLAFEKMKPVLSVVLSLMGGTALGMVVMMSFLTEISLIAGMIVGAVLTFWVCQIVFNQRLCGIRRQWTLAVSAAVLMLGVAVLHTDALGYDRFLPERGELTAITYQPLSWDSEEIITLTGDEALDAAYTWCTLMHDEVNGYENGLISDQDALSDSDVVVTYQMGSRKVHRHYPNRTVRTEVQDSLRQIIESEDYKQSLIGRLDSGCVTEMYIDSMNEAMNRDAFYEKFDARTLYRGYRRVDDSLKVDLLLDSLKQDILNRTLEEKQERPILSVMLCIESPDADPYYAQMRIYPGDENFLRAVFGEQAQEIVQYVSGGFAQSEDIVVLKVDYTQTHEENRQSGANLQDVVKSVTVAGTPEEAKRWIEKSQETSARERYYMPFREDQPIERLYIYQLSEVTRYSGMYGYKVPENQAEFYAHEEIPMMMALEYVGEN